MRNLSFHLSAMLCVLALLLTACASEEAEVARAIDTGEKQTASNSPAVTRTAEGFRGVRPFDDGTFRIVTTTTQASDLATILTEGVAGIEMTPLMVLA